MGCSRKAVLRRALRATAIPLPFEMSVERRASTHEIANQICAASESRVTRRERGAWGTLVQTRCCSL
jgi:hypothetical protein